MPELSGVELLHHARETQPDTVRLLLTGYANIRAVIGGRIEVESAPGHGSTFTVALPAGVPG